MKIVCKMTSVFACCWRRRKGEIEADNENERLAEQHNACHACSSIKES